MCCFSFLFYSWRRSMLWHCRNVLYELLRVTDWVSEWVIKAKYWSLVLTFMLPQKQHAKKHKDNNGSNISTGNQFPKTSLVCMFLCARVVSPTPTACIIPKCWTGIFQPVSAEHTVLCCVVAWEPEAKGLGINDGLFLIVSLILHNLLITASRERHVLLASLSIQESSLLSPWQRTEKRSPE